MSLVKKVFFSAVLLLVFVLMPTREVRAAGQCFCSTDYGQPGQANAQCTAVTEDKCSPENIIIGVSKTKECAWKSSSNECDTAVKDWRTANDVALGKQATTDQQQNQIQQNKGLIRSAIPDCVFEDSWAKAVAGGCGDISVFVFTLIGFGRSLFTVIGALALVMFIYGGFILILSQGNPEKVKKGTGAMVAAVIGLVIAFGGYVLVKFLGDAVGLKEGFRLK